MNSRAFVLRVLCVVSVSLCTGCSSFLAGDVARGVKATPETELTIEAEKETIAIGEDLGITLTIKNLRDVEVSSPEAYWSAIVLLNGKEYKRLPEHSQAWNGAGWILANGGMLRSILTLREYGICSEGLAPGRQELVVEIDHDMSNQLTFEIVAE